MQFIKYMKYKTTRNKFKKENEIKMYSIIIEVMSMTEMLSWIYSTYQSTWKSFIKFRYSQ